MKARENIQGKMIGEEQKRLDHEGTVNRMEQEERELIERLKNT